MRLLLAIACVLFSSFTSAQPQTNEYSDTVESRDLDIPFDPDNANDSEFLKHLLLSHGLELRLDRQGAIGSETYSRLLNSIGQADAQENDLIKDVRHKVELSLWSGQQESKRTLFDVDTSHSDVRIVWWKMKAPGTAFDATVPTVRERSADHDEPERPLLDNIGETVPSSLTERLRLAGYDVEFGEECQPRANQESRINDWLNRGGMPGDVPSPVRSPMPDVHSFGVSPEWRVIWLECTDGIALTRVPHSSVVQAPPAIVRLPIETLDSTLIEPLELPMDVPVVVPMDVPLEAPMDVPVVVPMDVPLEAPMNVPIVVPMDVPLEVPMDVPVDVLKDVPLDIPLDVRADAPSVDTSINIPTQESANDLESESESSSDSEPYIENRPGAPRISVPAGIETAVDYSVDTDTNKNQSDKRSSSRVQLNDDVPAGFEALAGPQFVFVDIYFNDQMLVATGAMASSDEVVFDNPEEIAELLNESVTSDDLVSWLSEPLSSNGHLACYAENDPVGCGQLRGDPVSIIYNEMLLRVDLFVDQAQQAIKDHDRERHLAGPEQRNTAIFSVYALASEFDGEARNIDMSGRALLGYGRGHLTAEVDYSDQQDRKRLRELKLTHYLNDYELAAGTYAYHTGGALPDLNLIGAGFATSFKTRVDLEHAFSSQLVVYLATRSVVQLVIDDRIYAGDSYAAGNQVLDTSGLPDGTYEVEIRIIDPASGTRSERRIFTKSTQIPPHGEAVINLTAGRVLDVDSNSSIPVSSDLSVAGASYTRRLTDQSAYRLGLLQFDSTTFAQTEFLYLGPSLSYQLTASAGGSGTLAAGVQAGFDFRNVVFNVSGSYYKTDYQAINDSVQSSFFLSDYSQVSLSASRAFEGFSVGARASERHETSDEDLKIVDRQFSLFAQKPLFKGSGKRGFIGTRFLHSELEQRAEITVDVYFDNRRSLSGSLGSRFIEDSQSEQLWADASIGWRSPDSSNGRVQSNAYMEVSKDDSNSGLRVELDHPWFTANAATDRNVDHEQNQSTQNSVASFSAHFGVDHRGAGMGGSDFAQAGVIIDVAGEPDGAIFDVMIDNIHISTGKIGQQQFIGLQPFRRYELKLVPRTLLGNGIADNIHRFTLFPGGVQRVSVEARRQLLLIATIVDEQGQLVTDALVQSEQHTIIIADDSILQIEIYESEKLSVRLNGGRTCIVSVPENSLEDVLVVDEPLVCRASQ